MGIRIFGKNVFQIYDHFIMKIDHDAVKDRTASSGHILRAADMSNISAELQPVGTTVTAENLKRLVSANKGKCEGFVFCEPGGRSVGTIWVMYRGTNDIEYRIRDIDAYIFDIYVNEAYRGNGYAGEMICQLMNRLYDKGINSAFLAVSKKNNSAVKAYVKTGFKTVDEKRFARILKINIPYHKL